MRHTLKRLSLGLASIAVACAVLLLSDLSGRKRPARALPRVAVLQHASQPIIDEGYAGLIEGLAAGGYAEGQGVTLRRYNAEGDVSTANAMAQEIVSGNYDLIVSLTTPSLQAIANANKAGKTRHVFGMVVDPTISGVGVGKEPLDHPAHMVGIGTRPPVAESLRVARKMFPELKTLGVVWNPGEVNSEICTRLCREACKELQIELLEANSENTAGVQEAATSLIARDVDALWIGGDVSVLAAVETLVGLARKAKIPVFTCIPGNAAKGTLFDVGANYQEVGRLSGELAAKVLQGDSPAQIPTQYAVPPKLFINSLALKGLCDAWHIPAETLASADVLIDEQGEHKKSIAAAPPPAAASRAPLAKLWKIHILEYINILDVDEAERGVREGIKESGLVEGRDYEIKLSNAQGDMATLNSMVDAAISDQADLIVTLSTPTLQSTIQRVKKQPIVFTFIASPLAAGVAKTDTDHLPNVTGAYGAGDFRGMVALIRETMPGAKRVGTMFTPTEVNSVYNHDEFAAAARKAGLEIVSTGVSTPAEIPDAAVALCGKNLDLVCLPTSNLTASSFPSIVQATRRAKVPVFGFLSSLADQGAMAVIARDYYDMGHDAGELAVRVMRGEKPGQIPLRAATKSSRLFNLDAAKRCGITLPDALLKSAAKVIEN